MEEKRVDTEEEYLKEYNDTIFYKPSVAVDNIIFSIDEIQEENPRKLNEKKLKVLLLKRSNPPYKGKWTLPGSFIRENENLEQCAIRVLKQKTNFEKIYQEQLYTFGDCDRDIRTRVISVAYIGLVGRDNIEIKEKNIEETRWFDITLEKSKNKNEYNLNLKNQNIEINNLICIEGEKIKVIKQHELIGFDHIKLICFALNRIKNKIEYTNIALNLLPAKFTISELQKVYEIILNKKLTKGNFQRKISNWIEETDENRYGAYRPAKLYKKKEGSKE